MARCGGRSRSWFGSTRGLVLLLACGLLVAACDTPLTPGRPPLPEDLVAWHGEISIDWHYTIPASEAFDGKALDFDFSVRANAPSDIAHATYTGTSRQRRTLINPPPPPPTDPSKCGALVYETTGSTMTGPGVISVTNVTSDSGEFILAVDFVSTAPDEVGYRTYTNDCGGTSTTALPCAAAPQDPCWFDHVMAHDGMTPYDPNVTTLVGSGSVGGPSDPDDQGCCGTMTWRLSRLRDTDRDGVTDQQEQVDGTDPWYPEGASPVEAYAPVVYLAPGEAYRPTSTADFLKNSTLHWSVGNGCDDEVVDATPDAASLGRGAYSHAARGDDGDDCDPTPGNTEYTNTLTAPYQNGGNTGAADDEGFYLDVANGRYAGKLSTAPVYYQYFDRHFISYWFFYAYDKFVVPSVLPDQTHEGDWENVTVRLNCSNEPTEIAYYGHGSPTIKQWPLRSATDVTLEGATHPVVFSALGSHASYSTPGAHDDPTGPFDDQTGWTTPHWDTQQRLLALDSQPWWGYEGGWGVVQHTSPVPYQPKDLSGPLGPNPDLSKELAPNAWYGACQQ